MVNTRQRVVIVVGLLVLVLMGLFPPWEHVVTEGSSVWSRDAGYHPLVSPPAPLTDGVQQVRVDVSRLLIQAVVAAVACAASVVGLTAPRSSR